MQQAHVVLSGFVTGVGFRQFIKKEAERLGISGWVQNTEDEKVECVFEGKKEIVEQLIAICKKGPEIADVKEVKVNWNSPEGIYEDFAILETI